MEIAHESVTIFKGGVDMVDYREILRLNSLGYSRRRISSMVGSSHHTVDQTLAAAELVTAGALPRPRSLSLWFSRE